MTFSLLDRSASKMAWPSDLFEVLPKAMAWKPLSFKLFDKCAVPAKISKTWMSLRRIPAKVWRLEAVWLGSSPSTFLGTLSKGSSPSIWRFEGCFDSGSKDHQSKLKQGMTPTLHQLRRLLKSVRYQTNSDKMFLHCESFPHRSLINSHASSNCKPTENGWACGKMRKHASPWRTLELLTLQPKVLGNLIPSWKTSIHYGHLWSLSPCLKAHQACCAPLSWQP